MFYDELLQAFSRKNESVLTLVFRGFPQISLPSLFSGFVGIVTLAEPRSKTQQPRSIFESPFENIKRSREALILEIQPVALKNEFDYRKSDYKSQFLRMPKQATYVAIRLSSNFTWRNFHSDLDGRKLVVSFAEKYYFANFSQSGDQIEKKKQ